MIKQITTTQEPPNTFIPRSEVNDLVFQLRQQLHDLSQPLTVLSAMIDMVEAGFHEEGDIATSREALRSLFEIVNKMRALSSQYSPDRRTN